MKLDFPPLDPPAKPGRVALVFWDGHLSVAPSLLSGIQMLAEAGFEVDVFIRGWGWILPPIGPLPPGVRIIESALVRKLSFPSSTMVVPNHLGVLAGLPIFLALALKEAAARRYTAVFGVDPLGGFLGNLMARTLGAPFYFWSLELFHAPQSLRERVLTWMQNRSCRNAVRILVQDNRRADALLGGNGTARTKLLLVPNGPAGPPRRFHSDFLRRKLGIPSGLRIVLHAGMLDDCVLSLELAQSVQAWPDSFCLVLHANQTIPPGNPYVQKIRAAGGDRVFLSLDPVPASDVDEIIASAAIGLATYEKDLGPNWDLMASASGKLGAYLRHGIPVICTDQTGMRELMDSYRCGVAITSADELPAALSRISADYDAMRRGAVDCYLSEYEFSAHFAPVLESLRPGLVAGAAVTHALT